MRKSPHLPAAVRGYAGNFVVPGTRERSSHAPKREEEGQCVGWIGVIPRAVLIQRALYARGQDRIQISDLCRIGKRPRGELTRVIVIDPVAVSLGPMPAASLPAS